MNEIRFIAGSGRSGTTWILDALATANRLRPVFEPLHPYISEPGRRYAHRALSADEEHPALKEFLLGVCAGRGPRLWTQYRHQRRWLIPPADEFWSKRDAGRTKRHWGKFLREVPRMTADGFRRQPLIKCIRANLMLPWIARHLPCRVVLVVRHPGAVVESELRGRWNASYALDRFRDDARLHDLTHGKYRPLLARNLTHVEGLALRWVIENQWVMETARAHGIPVVHYEALRSTNDGGWSSLCAALGAAHRPDRKTLTRPSQQSGADRTIIPLSQSDRPRWITGLSQSDSREVQGILDKVEFQEYSMDEPNPRPVGTPIAPTGEVGAIP
jgi:hypothetical protein